MFTNTTTASSSIRTAAPVILHEDICDIIERLGTTRTRYEFANGNDIVAGRLVVDAIESDVVFSINPFSGDATVLKWKRVN